MAAFQPETLRLLRRDLAATVAQHKRDMERRRKLPRNSRSTMARTLDERVSTAVGVIRDLERLIAFAEGVNRVYAEHERGDHDGRPCRGCADCPDDTGRPARTPAAAELLARTPLATAFGDADPGDGAR
jgi:hypothetical protein